MTIRPIVRYPDPRLALPAQPVTVFDGALRDLAGDLLETMHAAPGIGITAPGASGHRLRAIARHEWAGTVRKKDQVETSRISQIAQVPSLLQEPPDC
jgi:peptide deformylase